MAHLIISQEILPIRNGHIVATVVKLTSASDNITVPSMSSDATVNSAAQLRRPGDSAVTVTQATYNTITLAGTSGDECLVVSHSDRPIVEAQEN